MKNLILASLIASVSAIGCGDSIGEPGPADTGTDTIEDMGGDTPDEDTALDVTPDAEPEVAVDTGPDVDPRDECEVDWVEEVRGSVVDDAGAPVDGAKAQLCVHIGAPDGNLICLRPEDTDSDGRFAITTPNSTRCVSNGSMRVFKPGSTFATTYCPIDTASDDAGILEISDAVVLFETQPVAELPAYGDAASARAITFPVGLEIEEFVPEQLGFEFTEDAYNNLGAARVAPGTAGLCFVDGEIEGLIAFTVEANLERSIAFALENVDEYAAGASIDLFVLGGLQTTIEGGDHVPETEWMHYGQGTVSDDGATIVGRLPAFTWLGYRLAE
jgi:hypothetical protein